MQPENQPPSPTAHAAIHTEPVLSAGPARPNPAEPVPTAQPVSGHVPYRGLRWFFIGPQGLRAGWSALIFVFLSLLFLRVLGTAATLFVHRVLHIKTGRFTATSAIIGGLIEVLAILGAGAVASLIERRRILDYNLVGPRRPQHVLFGLVAGFLALSALVGALAWGDWLHFGPVALSGTQIFVFAALWGIAFLLTALFEEGSFRCYLQFTFTRGISFWWALGAVAVTCTYLAIFVGGSASWGVYAAALLGLFPCYVLDQRAAPGSGGFWYAAWVTSTLFGFIHVSNPNEAWTRYLRCRLHWLCLLRKRAGNRLGLVGHRLPCQLGTGAKRISTGPPTAESLRKAATSPAARRAIPCGAEALPAPNAVYWC